MTKSPFSLATHLSIVWAITLAVLTTIEWRSLDREPLKETVFLPFIQREILLSRAPGAVPAPSLPDSDTIERGVLQTEVNIHFNGPLFLLSFFGPVLIFQGIAWTGGRLFSRQGRA
jgi:hypothetical protein